MDRNLTFTSVTQTYTLYSNHNTSPIPAHHIQSATKGINNKYRQLLTADEQTQQTDRQGLVGWIGLREVGIATHAPIKSRHCFI